MAGVGEVSAVVGLVATAAQLSKALITIAVRYKDAKTQIESFGREVGILGKVMSRLHSTLLDISDDGVQQLITEIADECCTLFAQLDVYKGNLYGNDVAVVTPTFRGRTRWAFQASDLEYLRTRVESMKTNLLLMITLQLLHSWVSK